MRIWFLSDTHQFHDELKIPEDIDIVIHSGDAADDKQSYVNEQETHKFLDWYSNLPIKNKVFVAGNHDVAIGNRLILPAEIMNKGIIYLEEASTEINGLSIFGSPFTPTFGHGWAFNKDRSKLDKFWARIPEKTDIIVVHGPPYGILDISENRDGLLEHCGDKALLNHVIRVRPIITCFGHIHNYRYHLNSGVLFNQYGLFINASCVEDGKFSYGAASKGKVITLDDNKNIIKVEIL